MRDLPAPLPTTVVRRNAPAPPSRPADVDWNTSNKFLNGPFAPWHEDCYARDKRHATLNNIQMRKQVFTRWQAHLFITAALLGRILIS